MKTAFVGGQLITGRHKAAIKDSLVMIDRGLIVYGGYDFKKQQKEHHSI